MTVDRPLGWGDPADDHYPYKRDAAEDTLNEPLGRVTATGADGRDWGPNVGDTVTGADMLSVRIVEASETYIEAQEQFRQDASERNRAELGYAEQILVLARQQHRAGRQGANVFTTEG